MKLPFLSLIACVSSTQIACDEKNKCHPKADCYQEKNKQENVQIGKSHWQKLVPKVGLFQPN